MKKSNIFIGFLIGFISLIVVLVLWWFGILNTFENKFYDLKFKLRGEKDHSREIVIVGLDNDSLARFGRWPWPRSILARGIRNLKKAGVKVVGVDIMFSEPSQDRNQDIIFRDALKYANCVVGSSVFEISYEKVYETVNDQIVEKEVETRTLVNPIPDLLKAYVATGYTNSYPGEDGVLRNATPVETYDDNDYYSLNAAVAARYLDKKPGELNIPKFIWVNYLGPELTFKPYSFTLIYDGFFPKDWIEGKIVLIGSTATGIFDHYPTPTSNMYPGVEFHATLIDNIISNSFIHSAPSAIVLLVMVLLVALLSQTTIHMKAGAGASIFAGSLLLYFFLTLLMFGKFGIHLDFFKPALGMILVYTGVTGYRFSTEEKEKRWIKKTFSSYMSPQVIKELAENPDKLKLGGEKKVMTVFFSDIRGFTTISEKYPPEEVVSILNEYLSAMTEIVFKYEGTLDKFVGDEIMAFWNSPLAQADHAMLAVNCSFDMLDKLAQLQEKWKQEGKPIIGIGIGLNTGEMIVGNMGSFQRMDYTVIGDNVNLTRQYDTNIIISEYTYEFVKDRVIGKHLGEVKVKGKSKPVNIYDIKRKP